MFFFQTLRLMSLLRTTPVLRSSFSLLRTVQEVALLRGRFAQRLWGIIRLLPCELRREPSLPIQGSLLCAVFTETGPRRLRVVAQAEGLHANPCARGELPEVSPATLQNLFPRSRQAFCGSRLVARRRRLDRCGTRSCGGLHCRARFRWKELRRRSNKLCGAISAPRRCASDHRSRRPCLYHRGQQAWVGTKLRLEKVL